MILAAQTTGYLMLLAFKLKTLRTAMKKSKYHDGQELTSEERHDSMMAHVKILSPQEVFF